MLSKWRLFSGRCKDDSDTKEKYCQFGTWDNEQVLDYLEVSQVLSVEKIDLFS